MIRAAAGLALPIVAALLVLLASGARTRRQSWLVTGALAVCLGIGASALVTFLSAAAGLSIRTAFAGMDAALWLIVIAAAAGAYLWGAPSRLASRTVKARATLPVWLARAGFAIVAAMALATVTAQYAAAPHGQWDAWAIWNQKARFIVRDPAFWVAWLPVTWSNPGHPFLVSLSVARLWAYAGNEATLIPAALCALWGAGVACAVIGALDSRTPRAWIAGALLIAPAMFTDLASAQTADLALSLFIIATVAWLQPVLLGHEPMTRRVLVAAAFVAGCSAWTKNEGFLFVAIATLPIAWACWRRQRLLDVGWWVIGAVPAVATILYYKTAMAPVGPEYMSERESEITLLTFLSDPARHALIWGVIRDHVFRWGGPVAHGLLPLTMAAGIAASARRQAWAARFSVSVAGAMLLGYYAVWLVSPLDTAWLVDTTFDRLLIQVWPLLILAAFAQPEPMPEPRRIGDNQPTA